MAGFFAGTAIAGAGFGGGFQGAIRSVIPLAAPDQRAGVLSVVYVISYLAMGLPAVIAGFLLVHEGDLLATAVQYGVAVMALAALALGGAVRTARQAAQADLVAAAMRPGGPADLGGPVPVPVPAPSAGLRHGSWPRTGLSRTARRSVKGGGTARARPRSVTSR